MNIPKYWEKKEVTFDIDGMEAICNIWGHSDGDPEAARRMIEEKIPQVEEAIRRRWEDEDGKYARGYKGDYYTVDFIREHRLEEISQDSEEIAVITRNSYGSKIINCPEVMFVDIDTDEEDESDYPPVPGHWSDQQGCLAALFGGGGDADPASQSLAGEPEEAGLRPDLSQSKITALKLVKEYVESRPGSGFRIYETTLGLRLIATCLLYTSPSPRD